MQKPVFGYRSPTNVKTCKNQYFNSTCAFLMLAFPKLYPSWVLNHFPLVPNKMWTERSRPWLWSWNTDGCTHLLSADVGAWCSSSILCFNWNWSLYVDPHCSERDTFCTDTLFIYVVFFSSYCNRRFDFVSYFTSCVPFLNISREQQWGFAAAWLCTPEMQL